jgi:hypothetical protein
MRNLLPGDSPIMTVSRELVDARYVLLAWSRSAEESPYVEGEIMHAFGSRKLLPVRIEKWNWPAFLSSVQYVDMTPDDDEAKAWQPIEARLQSPIRVRLPRRRHCRSRCHARPDRLASWLLPWWCSWACWSGCWAGRTKRISKLTCRRCGPRRQSCSSCPRSPRSR